MPSPSKTSISKPARRSARRPAKNAGKKPAPAVRRRAAASRKPLDVRSAGQNQVQNVPTSSWWDEFQGRVDAWYDSLPVPRINPDIVSGVALLIAFLVVVAVSVQLMFVAWLFLLVHLFLDGLSSAIERRYQTRQTSIERQHGVIADTLFDRASEGILFIIPPFFLPWFPLFLLNILLTLLSVRKHRSWVLPLRIAFFIVLSIQLLI